MTNPYRYNLPVDYTKLKPFQRRTVREQYIKEQKGKCAYCNGELSSEPPQDVLSKAIKWEYFPDGFLDNPVHLQHNHSTGMTEGAVHAYCNAVLWQYHGK